MVLQYIVHLIHIFINFCEYQQLGQYIITVYIDIRTRTR